MVYRWNSAWDHISHGSDSASPELYRRTVIEMQIWQVCVLESLALLFVGQSRNSRYMLHWLLWRRTAIIVLVPAFQSIAFFHWSCFVLDWGFIRLDRALLLQVRKPQDYKCQDRKGLVMRLKKWVSKRSTSMHDRGMRGWSHRFLWTASHHPLRT